MAKKIKKFCGKECYLAISGLFGSLMVFLNGLERLIGETGESEEMVKREKNRDFTKEMMERITDMGF